jgi:hypothetical protein
MRDIACLRACAVRRATAAFSFGLVYLRSSSLKSHLLSLSVAYPFPSLTQADAAAKAADELLGPRPGVLMGPLPSGLDPFVMWEATRYNL